MTRLPAAPARVGDGPRLARYTEWLARARRPWWRPDLDAYRDWLVSEGLKPATVSAYVSAVRVRYGEIAKDRDLLYGLMPPDMDALHRKAAVDELALRLQIATGRDRGTVKGITHQDLTDDAHYRPSEAAVRWHLEQIDILDRLGARDAAMLALMFCTGVRAAECVALEVGDLYRKLAGEDALEVREGKGAKSRLVPYGALRWHEPYVDHWRRLARIEAGPLWGEPITTRALALRFEKHPIDGRAVRPHDARRTYARWCYERGVPIDGIRANLGHDDVEVTWLYVGQVDVRDRLPGG